jgi:hypothetical protein
MRSGENRLWVRRLPGCIHRSASALYGMKQRLPTINQFALLPLVFAVAVAPLSLAQTPSPWLLPNFRDRLEIQLSNPSDHEVEALATIPVPEAARAALRFPGTMAIVVVPTSPATVLPSQADDLDGDGVPDEFVFPVKMAAGARLTVHVYYSTTLHDSVPWRKGVHASHSFGYNHATAALESEAIGYRTYGGFYLDVQARNEGSAGLNNSLVGYIGASAPSTAGRDIIHLGDTLGLGGLFLRSGHDLFRPPLNVPDYAHQASAVEAPSYRVIADGPLRAVVKAWMDRWTIGQDAVRIEALYFISAGAENVECRFRITPLSLSRSYEVGTGIRHLPKMRKGTGDGRLALEGEQEPAIGPLGLALYYDPKTAGDVKTLTTPEGPNDSIVFRTRLEPGQAVSGRYWVAAAWSGSGIRDLLGHLAGVERQARAVVSVDSYKHAGTPAPERLEGEAF